MEMRTEEIEAYIATGEPLQCAGSFTIDGFGGAFIRKVDGDPTPSSGSPSPPCAGCSARQCGHHRTVDRRGRGPR